MIHALEGTLMITHAAPTIHIIDGKNFEATDINDGVAPASFRPTFKVE